jgi:ParB family chromosome partitioning protein
MHGGEVVLVPVEEITANPFQPRTEFSEQEIFGLAESIRTQGLLQPVLVRRSGSGYEIVSGERRMRALKHLGEKTVPCIVREHLSDREMLEMAVVENLQRENLNEIEKAKAYDKLLLECGLSHEQLSERIGASRSAVTNTLRLLKLPEPIQQMLRHGQLSMGHARALLAIGDPGRQQQLARRIVSEGLSVREIETAAGEHGHGRKKKVTAGKAGGSDPDTQQVIEKLQYKFGTAVNISSSPKGGGLLEIRFYSSDDLNRILDLLMK